MLAGAYHKHCPCSNQLAAVAAECLDHDVVGFDKIRGHRECLLCQVAADQQCQTMAPADVQSCLWLIDKACTVEEGDS